MDIELKIEGVISHNDPSKTEIELTILFLKVLEENGFSFGGMFEPIEPAEKNETDKK